MLYAVGLVLAFWLGTLISALITAKLVKETYQETVTILNNAEEMALLYLGTNKDNMLEYKSKYPYDHEMEKKFIQLINN